MKRQRSYGYGLDDDRRRFYDRGPPPPRRPPREYDGDRFGRRKGFGGGGGSYDSRHREYPSPREYGGDRAMQRSESFSGFRREFPKGFRSERDRSRRDGDGSSSWRRPCGVWRDTDGFDGYRAGARLPAASLHSPRRSRSRSPSEPRRRLEVAKLEKSRKQSTGISEMEEGEVAPDAEPKLRPAVVEHRKQAEPADTKEKGPPRPERDNVKKVDSGDLLNPGTQGKGVLGASDADNAGKEECKGSDCIVAEAGKAMDKGRENSVLMIEEKVGGGHEVDAQGLTTSDATKFGRSTSPIMPQEALSGKAKAQEDITSPVDVVGQNNSSSIMKEAIQEEVITSDETTNAIDEVGMCAPSSIRQGELQGGMTVLDKTGSATAEIGKSTALVLQEEALVLGRVWKQILGSDFGFLDAD
ncbi:hypothetical protein ACP70R_017155 [Stipagrostis hirtigluma subsp. patula]